MCSVRILAELHWQLPRPLSCAEVTLRDTTLPAAEDAMLKLQRSAQARGLGDNNKLMLGPPLVLSTTWKDVGLIWWQNKDAHVHGESCCGLLPGFGVYQEG